MSSSLNGVLEFLASLHASGKAYSTINVHRSMLSKTLPPIDGRPLGHHPFVKSLLSGCYNLNPPKPRYDSTWDPGLVIRYVSSLGNNASLSLSVLAHKTVTLIALATLLRVTELASIVFESVAFSVDGVRFSLSNPRKTQHGGVLESKFIPRLQDESCCPVAALSVYLDRTARSRSVSAASRVFVSLKSPFGSITKDSVGRWIRSFIGAVGVDTSVFGAHSTRGAAASCAFALGLSVDAVLRAGSWASESTFRRFYRREVVASVASTVLGQHTV